MNLYSSRNPFNDDPTPYVQVFGGERISAEDAKWTTRVVEHWPRPEYERPQSNPTNPLLVALRERDTNREAYIRGFFAAKLDRHNWPGWSFAQMEHADRVLKRLARLYRISEFHDDPHHV